MQLLPSTPSSASTSARTSTPAGEAPGSGPAAFPTLSGVRNAYALASSDGLPSYGEAVARATRIEQYPGVNEPLHGVAAKGGKLIRQSEPEQWKPINDAIGEFARSPLAAEGNFSAEKVDPVLHAIATWTNMVMQRPQMMKPADAYDCAMRRARADALEQLALLHNNLQRHVKQAQPSNPTCTRHFVDLAAKIRVFIQAMK